MYFADGKHNEQTYTVGSWVSLKTRIRLDVVKLVSYYM